MIAAVNRVCSVDTFDDVRRELAQLRMSSTSASRAGGQQSQQDAGRLAAAEARAAQASAAAATLRQRLDESSGKRSVACSTVRRARSVAGDAPRCHM
jgi:hypothetical protein